MEIEDMIIYAVGVLFFVIVIAGILILFLWLSGAT